MSTLGGKVVLVTSGMGREGALLAASKGASVVVNDLRGSLSGGD
jgi:NAD(P)-dependent dehydrogenase (short-subunit alcohol dehydrogenase family)